MFEEAGKILSGQYRGKSEDGTAGRVTPVLEDGCSDFDPKEINRAIEESIRDAKKGKNVIDVESQLEEDEQLAKGVQESFFEMVSPLSSPSSPPPQSPPRIPPSPPQSSQTDITKYDYGRSFSSNPSASSPTKRVCAGCRGEIGRVKYLLFEGDFWHRDCFRCHTCNQPISDTRPPMDEGRPYHKSCFKDLHHPKCDVCKEFLTTDDDGNMDCVIHPFWREIYCPSHENEGTPRCCSCERTEPNDVKYLRLDDGRKLCLECLDSSIMDTHECQPLYFEILEFFEGLNMALEQKVPLHLVERQALNEAQEGEKHGRHDFAETNGICLSEEQTVRTIIKRPKIDDNRVVDVSIEPYRLVRHCEVTAILVLYGLPRLLTGSILAHEMMHAWLRLKGFHDLSPVVEEGICQVLAHMWLDSEVLAGSGGNTASTSPSPAASSSASAWTSDEKKGDRSLFEKKLGEFFKHQIESDTSPVYGDGFQQGNKAVLKFNLKPTLNHIKLTGSFPV